MVVPVTHKDIPIARIDHNPIRTLEKTVCFALGPKGLEMVPLAIEDLHSMVARITHQQVPIERIKGKGPWSLELTFL